MRTACMLWGNASQTAKATIIITTQLSGLVNGVNTVFTTPSAYQTGKISVFLNGLKLKSTEFTETDDTTITLSDAPLNHEFTDEVSAIFTKK